MLDEDVPTRVVVRARAPLRVSFAGGGTDVPPFPEQEGGAVLCASINRYAHASLATRKDGRFTIHSADYGMSVQLPDDRPPSLDGKLDLITAAICRLRADDSQGYDLYLHSVAPPGSGLGSSSSVVVAIVGVLNEHYGLALSPYQKARLAWKIERQDLGITGGQQDQYAATFGGLNYIEFLGDQVVVNPLRMSGGTRYELEHNLLLCFTGTTRVSSQVIDDQTARVTGGEAATVEAMRAQRTLADEMRRLLLRHRVDDFGALLDEAWQHKKRYSPMISNPFIDDVYAQARAAGALGGKITGAGGGGYLLLYCPFERRANVAEALRAMDVTAEPISFDGQGCSAWRP